MWFTILVVFIIFNLWNAFPSLLVPWCFICTLCRWSLDWDWGVITIDFIEDGVISSLIIYFHFMFRQKFCMLILLSWISLWCYNIGLVVLCFVLWFVFERIIMLCFLHLNSTFENKVECFVNVTPLFHINIFHNVFINYYWGFRVLHHS